MATIYIDEPLLTRLKIAIVHTNKAHPDAPTRIKHEAKKAIEAHCEMLEARLNGKM